MLGEKDGVEVAAVSNKLKFVHYLQSCALTTSGKQLPKWGYEQQEVSCNPNLRDVNAIWNVEENIFSKRTIFLFSFHSFFFVRIVILLQLKM